MNDKNLNLLTIKNFHLGQIVCHILPNGEEGAEGVVVGKDSRHIEVLFDDAIRPRTMNPSQLKIKLSQLPTSNE